MKVKETPGDRGLVGRFQDLCEKLGGEYLPGYISHTHTHICKLPDAPPGSFSELVFYIERDSKGRFREGYEYQLTSPEMYADPKKVDELNVKVIKETNGQCYVLGEVTQDREGNVRDTGYFFVQCGGTVYTKSPYEHVPDDEIIREFNYIKSRSDEAYKKAMKIIEREL